MAYRILSSYFVFLFLCVSVFGALIEPRLDRARPSKALKGLQQPCGELPSKPQENAVQGVVTVPVLNYFPRYFVTDLYGWIWIGTPAQPFCVHFDDHDNTIWVANENITSTGYYHPRTFAHEKSSTFKPIGDHFQDNRYMMTTIGVMGNDSVTPFGTKMRFGMASWSTYYNDPPIDYDHLDGTFGINLDTEKDHTGPTAMEVLARSLRKPIFTIWPGTSSDKSALYTSGQLTFGSEDHEHCAPLTDQLVPLDDPLRYEVMLHSVEAVSAVDGKTLAKWNVNSTFQLFGQDPVIDELAGNIFAATKTVYEMYKQFGVSKSAWPYWNSMDCSPKSELPHLILHLGNKAGPSTEFLLTQDDYILKEQADRKDGKCGFLFAPSFSGVSWEVGVGFSQKWCTVFDISAGKMGLARRIK